MKKQKHQLFLLMLVSCISLFAKENEETHPSEEVTPTIEISKLSEAFGHLIGKNLENIGVKFDMAKVIQGLQDESTGKDSPMSEMECVQAINSIQEAIFKEQCSTNLAKADQFLSENTKKSGVVALEDGKVQYCVVDAGAGAQVEAHFSPLILYTGKYLDGTIFSASKEAEVLSLDEIIPGLRSGLIGMKEGEKRVIHIHPELAYGTSGYLQPNSLLTFEVEVVKVNSPKPETPQLGTKPSSEIADGKTDVR